jgi:magnesium transporter
MSLGVCVYNETGHREGLDPADISEVVGTPGTVVWVDLDDPSDTDFNCVQDEFSLHPLAMEDARKHGQRPKLERYPTHAFAVAYSAHGAEVDIFVGPGWIVTVRGAGDDGRPWDSEPARHRFERSGPEEATSGFLLYTILDELVDGYFARIDEAEDRLEVLEEEIFDDRPDEAGRLQQDLYDLRREVVGFRRQVQPLRDVLARLLRREVDWIDNLALTHLQDVYDHVLRVVEQVDVHRELMNNAHDAHLALMSTRMNQVMKKMTPWGALLLGSTLIAGIYGMNFEHMPELGWRYGYLWALGLMAAVTLLGYRYFKGKDWL